MPLEPFAFAIYREYVSGKSIERLSIELDIPPERVAARLRAARHSLSGDLDKSVAVPRVSPLSSPSFESQAVVPAVARLSHTLAPVRLPREQKSDDSRMRHALAQCRLM
jgi:hypothetical protein